MALTINIFLYYNQPYRRPAIEPDISGVWDPKLRETHLPGNEEPGQGYALLDGISRATVA